ncbi:putative ribonuclease H-like domain-containing protein, partial [Tanacetum coccineum]
FRKSFNRTTALRTNFSKQKVNTDEVNAVSDVKGKGETAVKSSADSSPNRLEQEEGIDYDEVFAPVARIKAIRIFLAVASYMGFIVYQMGVKSAFLYGKIDEEVYVSQPLDFIDPKYPKKVYKVVKALYGLHQAPEPDDIIFGSTKKSWCDEFEALMKSRFQMSSMGELTFFLGLQVKQKEDGIFISQDKYVAEILKKFDFVSVKTASTPIETQKPLVKDEEASDVDVHLYRSMISSLMYLTASRPDIMYLKGKPKLGLWYPRVSSFDLEAYSDSDYAGANLDRKSTTGGCQFLGRRLISWQCKKQTIVATSTTEAEYVAAANCCGQVLWIQNQMLDYGFNFMNTKIYIDNESTICIVKNPVFHSKTKHIAIRHHFIRDAYEKKLIQVLKIHTDDNVADLLTKAFDVSQMSLQSNTPSEDKRRPSANPSSFSYIKLFYQMDVKSVFLYGKINEEVYVSQPPGFIDPKCPKKVYKVVKALYGLHQAPRACVKTASTPIKTQKLLVKDEEASDVDVHLYRSMIGSLMYLTASRPDIMFAVCACSRFQVTPKTSHLSVVKRIFRYLKGKPKLGLWYPRVSSFDLEAYSDSDYAGANLDRKSTTGGCQFLGRRLISWQCKKQTIVATSTTEAEYVAAANCCGQDQTVLGKDYSNLLIADSLLKTIWFINAPCYGNEALASPKANELTIPEQTATGKGKSNPFMAVAVKIWLQTIAKDVKGSKRSRSRLWTKFWIPSLQELKKNKPKKHEVKQVQQSCLGEDCWEIYIPNLVPQAARAKEPPTSFDEFNDTSFDFSAFVLNRLKILNLTQEILAGPAFNLLKGTCMSIMKLECHLEECSKATTKRLDWHNPKNKPYMFDLRKPLPLIQDHRGCQIIPKDYFIIKDLEYLKGGDLSKRYSTSVTKTKAATYELKWIEDLVPELWSPMQFVGIKSLLDAVRITAAQVYVNIALIKLVNNPAHSQFFQHFHCFLLNFQHYLG